MECCIIDMRYDWTIGKERILEEKSDMYRAWEDIETELKKYTRQDFLVSSGN